MLLIALIGTAVSGLPIKAEPIGNPASWIAASDFPATEWSRATVTSYDLTLDETGRPIACTIAKPSGSEIIDKVVCSSFMKRGRYKPARDSSGTTLPFVLRDHVLWHPDTSEGNRYLEDTPDVIVSTEAARSKRRFDIVKVVEIVSASGTVERCDVYKPSPVEELNSQACAIVDRPELLRPVVNAAGLPVRGIRAFNVGFIADAVAGIVIR